jgi:copper homeostasis protein
MQSVASQTKNLSALFFSLAVSDFSLNSRLPVCWLEKSQPMDGSAFRMPRPVLEICAETLESCLAARDGGADRIELCSFLSVGGLTPSHGLLSIALAQSQLPIHVLVRPRPGDFVYSSTEFEIMIRDVEHAKALGAAGCVIGLLLPDGTVDVERTKELVALAGPLEVTFHRAFDHTRDLPAALEQVIACGCRRLLTSGGQPKVSEGAPTLAKLVEQAGGRIRIAAGGGVTLAAAPLLLQYQNLDLHASFRGMVHDPLWSNDVAYPPVSVEDVRKMVALIAGGGQ